METALIAQGLHWRSEAGLQSAASYDGVPRPWP
ncbi:hypothetical protein QFZ70_002520 [Arthrobacter sp. V1I9]|nr:hypothetical protein [Arthrobacter sp. V1I9]